MAELSQNQSLFSLRGDEGGNLSSESEHGDTTEVRHGNVQMCDTIFKAWKQKQFQF